MGEARMPCSFCEKEMKGVGHNRDGLLLLWCGYCGMLLSDGRPGPERSVPKLYADPEWTILPSWRYWMMVVALFLFLALRIGGWAEQHWR